MPNKLYFPKRIPEPSAMGEFELKEFEKVAKDNYAQWILPLVDHALEVTNLKEGKILDVGCGPGLLVKGFAEASKKFKVIGLDISSNALRQSRENCKKFPNTSFKQGSVSELPFIDNTFDLVVTKDSVHHFPNLKTALKEIYRVTKPGGHIYLQDLKRDIPWYLLKLSIPPNNPFQKLQYYSARASYTKQELKKVLQELGLKPTELKTRLVTNTMRKKYKGIGIDSQKLKISFQTRYIAIIRKRK